MEGRVRLNIFRFEPAWVKQEGFTEWVLNKWPERRKGYI